MEFYYKTIEDFYNMVREKVGNLSIDDLSDSIIDRKFNAPMAEIQVKKQVSEWENLILEETSKMMFDNAIIILTAIKLSPMYAKEKIISHQTPTIKVQLEASRQSLLDVLNMEYNGLINDINGYGNGTAFTVISIPYEGIW